MNLTNLARTIYTRLTSDTGPGGLFNATDGLLYDATRGAANRLRRNYSTDVEEQIIQGKPMVVYRITGANASDQTQMSDGITARVIFDIYGRPPIIAADNGDTDLFSIADRIYGDASTQVRGAPSYGLHRFEPNDTTWDGWTYASQFQFENVETSYDEKTIMITQTFTIRYSRTFPLS